MTRSSLWAALALTLGAFVASAALYPSLPDRLPIHWDLRGQVDRYGAKVWAAFLLPALMGGMAAFFALMPWLSPRSFAVGNFRPVASQIMVLVVALFGYLHGVTLMWALRPPSPGGRAVIAGFYLFFALLGNLMGKVRRNFFIGVRVPWTLASERVWNDTHRLAAWLFVGAGLVGFALTLAGYFVAALAVLIVAVVVPVAYSFVHYKGLERRGEIEPAGME